MHKYKVIATKGEGAYGIVMKCKRKIDGAIVAIKKFKEKECEDDLVKKTGKREQDILEMVKNEAKKKLSQNSFQNMTFSRKKKKRKTISSVNNSRPRSQIFRKRGSRGSKHRNNNEQQHVPILQDDGNGNIIRLNESFKKKGRLYLVFEYVSKNLLEILEEVTSRELGNGDDPSETNFYNNKFFNVNEIGGLNPELVKYYLYQLLKAVNFLHDRNVIHRDIKPENLLIDVKTNQLKLCDFGFARKVKERSVRDVNGSEYFNEENELTEYVSTRWYRSPEMILSKNYGKPSDVWSVGCLMGELLLNDALFAGDSDLDQLYLIQKFRGEFSKNQINLFLSNPRFQDFHFPKCKKKKFKKHKLHLLTQLNKVIDDIGIGFLLELLETDPKKRITAKQALNHQYFNDLDVAKFELGKNSKNIQRSRGDSREKRDKKRKKSIPYLAVNLTNKKQQIGNPFFPSITPRKNRTPIQRTLEINDQPGKKEKEVKQMHPNIHLSVLKKHYLRMTKERKDRKERKERNVTPTKFYFTSGKQKKKRKKKKITVVANESFGAFNVLGSKKRKSDASIMFNPLFRRNLPKLKIKKIKSKKRKSLEGANLGISQKVLTDQFNMVYGRKKSIQKNSYSPQFSFF